MSVKSRLLVAVVAMAIAEAASLPAAAQRVQVYTDKTLFDSQRPGITSNTFSFSGTQSATYLGQSYTQAGVNFSVPTQEYIYGLAPDATLIQPHLAVLPQNSTSPTLTISFAGPVLGLELASYYGAQTISYLVNGTTSGTLLLPANEGTTFVGFDTGSLRPISATFTFMPNAATQSSTLDVVSFQTALPEPGTWAFMIIGVGMVGYVMRRRQKGDKPACSGV